MSKKILKIVIAGRPNVGKSTLFNRLVGWKRALVHNESGVTRDRLEEVVEWWYHGQSYSICVTDTGGLGGERFEKEIQDQADIAFKEADVVLFVLDSQVGVTSLDRQLFKSLKQLGIKNIQGIVNKIDHDKHAESINEFYELDCESLFSISAEHGLGIDDLKNDILEKNLSILKPISSHDKTSSYKKQFARKTYEEAMQESSLESLDEKKDSENDEFTEDLENIQDADENKNSKPSRYSRIALVGRPNVGKSTLTNALLGRSRMIVSPIAGTTVDAIDSLVVLSGQNYILTDTAGIRRKSKTEQGIEVLSIVQTKKALENADLAILLLDAESGVIDQDEKIAGLIEEEGCSLVLALNKWDTQKKNPKFTQDEAAETIRSKMRHLKYVPIVFMSAIQGKGIEKLGDLFEEILLQRKVRIPTHEFTEWVRAESEVHNPMNAKFYLCHQTSQRPPTFVCHVNDPEKIDFSLKRHLINALRERWGYMGTPIRLLFKEAKNRKSLPKPS